MRASILIGSHYNNNNESSVYTTSFGNPETYFSAGNLPTKSLRFKGKLSERNLRVKLRRFLAEMTSNATRHFLKGFT